MVSSHKCQSNYGIYYNLDPQSCSLSIPYRNDRQRTPLVCAIRAGSNEIVKLLIEAGAGTDVDHGEEVNNYYRGYYWEGESPYVADNLIKIPGRFSIHVP